MPHDFRIELIKQAALFIFVPSSAWERRDGLPSWFCCNRWRGTTIGFHTERRTMENPEFPNQGVINLTQSW